MITPPHVIPALPNLAAALQYLLLRSDLAVLSQHHWLSQQELQPLWLGPLNHVCVIVTAVLVVILPAQHIHTTQTPVLYLLVAMLHPSAALTLSALADVLPV
jgi:hypothetical protein